MEQGSKPEPRIPDRKKGCHVIKCSPYLPNGLRSVFFGGICLTPDKNELKAFSYILITSGTSQESVAVFSVS